jgi:hypothetical protein
MAGYGQTWTCPKCGKTYDTSTIPSAEYGAILTLTKRYQMVSVAIVSVLAIIVLVVALTGQTVSIFAGLAVSLLSWFLYIRPLVHRRHKRAVAQLTRNWDIKAEQA